MSELSLAEKLGWTKEGFGPSRWWLCMRNKFEAAVRTHKAAAATAFHLSTMTTPAKLALSMVKHSELERAARRHAGAAAAALLAWIVCC